MGRRLISLMAALAIGTMGALAFAAPSNAATPAVAATSILTGHDWCDTPEDLKDLPKVAQAESQTEVSGILPQVLQCIEVNVVDKCDGTTVVTLTNWAKVDATWTRLTVEILDHDYVVKGGPDHTPVVITLGPPGVVDVQAYLVFEGSHNGTSWRIEKAVGDPYSWKLPEACPTASPSPSVTASASPSPSASTSTVTTAPSTTKPAAAPAGNDLPVTGASMTLSIVTFIGLLVAGVVTAVYMRFRRQRATQ